jgi:hypothetical protein
MPLSFSKAGDSALLEGGPPGPRGTPSSRFSLEESGACHSRQAGLGAGCALVRAPQRHHRMSVRRSGYGRFARGVWQAEACPWSFYISVRSSCRSHRASTRPRLMPCIRAWLQPCRWRQSLQGFSPCCLPPCQVRETIGELLRPLDQSRLHRVRRYVFPEVGPCPTLY